MSNQSNTMYCPKCGTVNSIYEKQCTNCNQVLFKYSSDFIPDPQPNMYTQTPYQQMPYQQMYQQNKEPVKTPILNFFCLLSIAISYFLRFTPLWTLSYICVLIWLIVYVVLVNHYKDSGRDISSLKTTRNTVCILFVLLFCINFVVYI